MWMIDGNINNSKSFKPCQSKDSFYQNAKAKWIGQPHINGNAIKC